MKLLATPAECSRNLVSRTYSHRMFLGVAIAPPSLSLEILPSMGNGCCFHVAAPSFRPWRRVERGASSRVRRPGGPRVGDRRTDVAPGGCGGDRSGVQSNDPTRRVDPGGLVHSGYALRTSGGLPTAGTIGEEIYVDGGHRCWVGSIPCYLVDERNAVDRSQAWRSGI